MKIVKNILLFSLLITLAYGLIGSKSIAYCCGNCHVMEKPVEEKSSCCSASEEHGPSHDHDCKGDPCKVVYLQYDWNAVDHTIAVSPVLPVFDLFYSVQSLLSFRSETTGLLLAGDQEPPPVIYSPRKYLSFIRMLII